MAANTSTVRMSPLQGDYAAGVRTKPQARGVRGTFATGMSASTPMARARYHGDFAAGIRSHLHQHNVVLGDFASRVDVGVSPTYP
jgi:hypothetical protein